jgi:hypothetical protein
MSSQKRNSRLNDYDFYPTPSWCYENLDIDWSLFKTAHEPCRGDGRIQQFLENNGIKTTYSELREGKDFFDWDDKTDLIFTNPPFSIAKEFVDHSVSRSETVVMLLRLNFLGSKTRHDWWNINKPTSLYILSQRPSFTGKGTDSTEYAWFVWDKTNRIPNGTHFVKPPTKEQIQKDNESCKIALSNI